MELDDLKERPWLLCRLFAEIEQLKTTNLNILFCIFITLVFANAEGDLVSFIPINAGVLCISDARRVGSALKYFM